MTGETPVEITGVLFLCGGWLFVGFAEIFFVVGAADDEVAGDVEGGIGGVEGGFDSGADWVIGEE